MSKKRDQIRKVLLYSISFSSPEPMILLVCAEKLRPLTSSNTRSLRFTDSSNMTNLIGWKYWTSTLRMLTNQDWPEVWIPGADQKDCRLWGWKWFHKGWAGKTSLPIAGASCMPPFSPNWLWLRHKYFTLLLLYKHTKKENCSIRDYFSIASGVFGKFKDSNNNSFISRIQ